MGSPIYLAAAAILCAATNPKPVLDLPSSAHKLLCPCTSRPCPANEPVLKSLFLHGRCPDAVALTNLPCRRLLSLTPPRRCTTIIASPASPIAAALCPRLGRISTGVLKP
ncbi:hypothetical protein M0R45_008917 [Rubus argutus]|uniref:Secreted protein n=1 Tax=Rubus argutus TaxID=59490 RepID=A0AAW1Y525_RUBAR